MQQAAWWTTSEMTLTSTLHQSPDGRLPQGKQGVCSANEQSVRTGSSQDNDVWVTPECRSRLWQHAAPRWRCAPLFWFSIGGETMSWSGSWLAQVKQRYQALPGEATWSTFSCMQPTRTHTDSTSARYATRLIASHASGGTFLHLHALPVAVLLLWSGPVACLSVPKRGFLISPVQGFSGGVKANYHPGVIGGPFYFQPSKLEEITMTVSH